MLQNYFTNKLIAIGQIYFPFIKWPSRDPGITYKINQINYFTGNPKYD